MSVVDVAGAPARERTAFLLQRVQPAMTGLIDGSLSTRDSPTSPLLPRIRANQSAPSSPASPPTGRSRPNSTSN
jgi:hypothetical protein